MSEEQENSHESTITSSTYPDGPITCCLRGISKEVRVLRHRSWTVSLMMCCLSTILSLVLFLVAFGTTGWVRVKKIDEVPPWDDMVGLWQECVHGTCSPIDGAITGAGFKVSQAFAVLCLILILVGCLLTVKYSFSASPKRSTGNTAMILRFITFFTLLILIPVFAMTWDKNHERYDKDYYADHMDYSFILVAVVFVLEAMGAFFMYCEVIIIQRAAAKPLLSQSKIVDRYDGVTNEGFTEVYGPGIHPSGINLNQSHDHQERLADQIKGRMNAKAAYENFAFSELQPGCAGGGVGAGAGAGMAGVAGPLGTSMFTSSQEIAKRFVGITLAEPPYTKYDGNQTMDNEGAEADTGQYYRQPQMIHSITAHDTTQDSIHMQQSVSMQNVFNENLAQSMKPQPNGRLVTSVSMYNISDETPAQSYQGNSRRTGEKDDFSMRSWHPESIPTDKPNVGPHNRTAPHTTNNTPSRQHAAQEIRSDSQIARPRTNRGPVQRRLDANRQANNSVNNSSSPSNVPFKSMYSARTNLSVSDEVVSPDQTSNKEGTIIKDTSVHTPNKPYPPYENTNRFDKNKSHEPTAPSRRKRDRMSRSNEHNGSRDQINPILQTTPLSRAQSNMSLHSVVSTATSIVGGCAETEI